MRRVLSFCLFVALSLQLHSASAPAPFGIYHGTWTVTNARTEVVTSGPLSVVFRSAGKPMVHLWLPIETESGTDFMEYFKAASRPARRSIAWSYPRVGRLQGKHSPDEQILRSVNGTLRLNVLGRGAFNVTRQCGTNYALPLLPIQLLLPDIYGIQCVEAQITNRPPGRIILPPTNRPPILPPTPVPGGTNGYQHVLERVEAVRSNRHPPIIAFPTNLVRLTNGVIQWYLPPDSSTQVIRAWTTDVDDEIVTPWPPIQILPRSRLP